MTLQSVDGPHLIRRRPLKKKNNSQEEKFCLQAAFGLELQHGLFPGFPASSPTMQIWGLPDFTIFELIP